MKMATQNRCSCCTKKLSRKEILAQKRESHREISIDKQFQQDLQARREWHSICFNPQITRLKLFQELGICFGTGVVFLGILVLAIMAMWNFREQIISVWVIFGVMALSMHLTLFKLQPFLFRFQNRILFEMAKDTFWKRHPEYKDAEWIGTNPYRT